MANNNYCPYEDEDCDCFALLVDGECFALQDTNFKDNICPFRKTADEVNPQVLVEIKKMNRRKARKFK